MGLPKSSYTGENSNTHKVDFLSFHPHTYPVLLDNDAKSQPCTCPSGDQLGKKYQESTLEYLCREIQLITCDIYVSEHGSEGRQEHREENGIITISSYQETAIDIPT